MRHINFFFSYLARKIRWVVFIFLLMIVAAFILGLTVKNWPLVDFKNELGLADILDVLTTLILAFLIPFFIKYFIDRSDKVSKIVIDAINSYRIEVEAIHLRFVKINESGKIRSIDRDQLLLDTENLDGRLTLLLKVVNRRCSEMAKDQLRNVKNSHFEYWRQLTGTEINSLSFESVDLDFARTEIRLYHILSEEIMNLEFQVVAT